MQITEGRIEVADMYTSNLGHLPVEAISEDSVSSNDERVMYASAEDVLGGMSFSRQRAQEERYGCIGMRIGTSCHVGRSRKPRVP
jgi:hypothetical protein